MDDPRAKAQEVHRRLMEVYDHPRWRNPLPPLEELISTILSQNTNDDNRDRAFARLRERFPTWEAVRDAPQEEVVQAIRSAGLANQKGPRIQSVLRQITALRGELDLDFLKTWPPQEVERWLLQFKGVGPKTAAIVMLFSLDMPVFPVDTHIHRLSQRLGLIPQGTSAEKAHPLLASLFEPEQYYPVHLNLIRHGRQICQARKPQCGRCLLQDLCAYYATLAKGDPTQARTKEG
jgi:endonuclease-3